MKKAFGGTLVIALVVALLLYGSNKSSSSKLSIGYSPEPRVGKQPEQKEERQLEQRQEIQSEPKVERQVTDILHSNMTRQLSNDIISNTTRDTRLSLVKKYYPLLLQKLSHQFLPEYKSPCFKSSGSVKCLPYFYLIGPPKCATTDLWFHVVRHPQIIAASGADPKEPHWWTRADKTKGKVYKKYLNRLDNLVQKAKTPALKRRLISGDGSASTIWDNHHIHTTTHRPKEIPFIWADVIHAVTPNVKIITILRNPVDRTISDYFAFFKKDEHKKSPQHFHENLTRVIDAFNECIQQNRTLITCASRTYGYPRLHISLYFAHIREWIRVFSMEQVLILRTEDWHHHEQLNILPKIYNFLDIDSLDENDLPKLSSRYQQMIKSKQASKKAQKIGEILPKSRTLLQEFFAPYNQQLAEFLDDDRFLWQD